MIRTLLTTSAIALVLSTAAIAQTATPETPAPDATTEQTMPADSATDPAAPAAGDTATDPMAPADDAAADPMAPADDAAAPADAMETDAMETDTMETDAMETDSMSTDMDMADEPWDMSAGYMAGEGDAIVSEVLGAPIFSSGAEDAEQIGTVNDLVISADGEIHAVVIGVGGFLGIGEKNVAVDFQSLEYTVAFDQTDRWVLGTTAEALTAAPDFVWEDDVAMDPAMDPAMAPADGMAPADPAMAPADPAAAPVTQ